MRANTSYTRPMQTSLLDSDLDHDIVKMKEAFRIGCASAALDLLPEYIEAVRNSQDPEVKRKGLVFFSEAAALHAVQPKDAKPELPIFHFNIGGPMTVSATDKHGEVQTLEFTPSEVMAARTHINRDVVFDD